MRNRFPTFRASNSRSFGTAASPNTAIMPGRSTSSTSHADATVSSSAADHHHHQHPSAAAMMFDGMDEDEIVARIMQQVRECESSSRRNLRRPKNGISYSLDKNGSIVPSPSGEEPLPAAASTSTSSDPESQQQQPQTRGRQLYSVDDCRKPIPSYQVEVNTDRVGSFYRDEMDDAFQYLMSGTPRRNQNRRTMVMQEHQQEQQARESYDQGVGASRRGRASGVVPRYMSVGRGKDDSDESFVEQYDLVQYEEESVRAAAATTTVVAAPSNQAKAAVVGTVPMTPRRSVVRDVRANPSPVPAKPKTKDPVPDKRGAEEAATVALNQSTSTHSSSSSAASPVPSSPNQVTWKVDVDKARANMASSGASVVTVTPTDVPGSALCAMAWMRGGDGSVLRAMNPSCATSFRRNSTPTDLESPPPTGASATAPEAAAPAPASLYERLALPLCRATSIEEAESYQQWHNAEDLSRESSYGTSDVESMMRRTTTITTVATQQPPSSPQEEEDVDILRPWGFASMLRPSKATTTTTSVTIPSRARSTKSATSSVLRTIRETGGSSDKDSNVDEPDSVYDEDDASSIVTGDDLRRHRSTIERRHGSIDPTRHRRRSRTDASSFAGTTVTGTTNASRSTAFRSRRGDDGSVSECTTLYDPATSQRNNYLRYPPGCMTLVQNVWQGIDRAERALLGSMSVDDDLWTDLYEDEYDLYSTEMTADRSEEDASLSTATSSHFMTAERSGLTTLSGDDRSHIVSPRRAGSKTVAMEKRSPRRSRYLNSRS